MVPHPGVVVIHPLVRSARVTLYVASNRTSRSGGVASELWEMAKLGDVFREFAASSEVGCWSPGRRLS